MTRDEILLWRQFANEIERSNAAGDIAQALVVIVDAARKVADRAEEMQPENMTKLREIAVWVAHKLGVAERAVVLRRGRWTKNDVPAKAITAYVMRQTTRSSWTAIGKALGRAGHSEVCRQAALLNEPDFRPLRDVGDGLVDEWEKLQALAESPGDEPANDADREENNTQALIPGK